MKTPSLPVMLFRAAGMALAILIMEILAQLADMHYARVPFVTSIVLALGVPEAPASTPRAIIGGHAVSALAGLVMLYALGSGDLSTALAVGLAGLVMMATRTLHPPAGLDAFLVVSQSLPAMWLLMPVLPGAVLLAGFAAIWRRLGDRLFSPQSEARAGSVFANLRHSYFRKPE